MKAADAKREARREADERGIPFDVVEATYRELRAMERESRVAGWELRREAWERAVPVGCHPFWRHGFAVRFPRAFGDGDRTLIPRFDELADELAEEFPWLMRADDPAEALFEFLAEPHDTLPSAAETWERAIHECDAEPAPDSDDVAFEFGANVEF